MPIHPKPDSVTTPDAKRPDRSQVWIGIGCFAMVCAVIVWVYYACFMAPRNQMIYYRDHPDALGALNEDQIPHAFMASSDYGAVMDAWVTAKINLARKTEKDPVVLALLSPDVAIAAYWENSNYNDPDSFIAKARQRAQIWEAFAANPSHGGFRVTSDGKIVSINQTVNRDILGASVFQDKGTSAYTFTEIDRLLNVTKATADNQAAIDSLRLTASSNR